MYKMNECEDYCRFFACYNRGQKLDWKDGCPECDECCESYNSCMRICVDTTVGIQKKAPDTD